MKANCILVVLAALIVEGCAMERAATSASPVPIPIVLENLRQFSGTDIAVEGDVGGTFGITHYGLFKLYSGNDSLLVLTSRIAPKRGQHVRVEGRLCPALVMDDIQIVLLLERDAQTDSSPDRCSVDLSGLPLNWMFTRLVKN